MRRYAPRRRRAVSRRRPRRAIRKARTYRRRRPALRRKKRVSKKIDFSYLNDTTAPKHHKLMYADYVNYTGATNNPAGQRMWCDNQTLSAGIPSNTYYNLCLKDPKMDFFLVNQGLLLTNEGKTARVMQMNESVFARLTNFAAGDIIVTHYRCKARQHVSFNDATDPTFVLQQGFADVQALPSGADKIDSNDPGATVFQNPRFVALYKVISTKTRRLRPGKSFSLRYTLKKPRLLKNEEIIPSGIAGTGNPKYQMYKGTSFSVFVIKGTIARYNFAAPGYYTGIGPAAVAIEYEKTVTYKFVTGQVSTSSVANHVPGFGESIATFPLGYINTHPDSVVVHDPAVPQTNRFYCDAIGGTGGRAGYQTTHED